MVAIPQASLPKPCKHLSSLPDVSHVQRVSFFFITWLILGQDFHLVNTRSGLQIMTLGIHRFKIFNLNFGITDLYRMFVLRRWTTFETICTKLIYQSMYTYDVTCECTCESVLSLITAIVKTMKLAVVTQWINSRQTHLFIYVRFKMAQKSVCVI